jgi:DNA polymerase
MTTMYLLDFETKSATDIKRGYDQYFQDPEADILCLAYGHWDAIEPELWWPGCGWEPEELFEYAESGGLIGASNAAFDQACWEYLGEAYGFPAVRADQWYCTQAQSRVAGLPSKLEDSAIALGLKVRKGPRGAALIKLMSCPDEDGSFQHTPALLAEMVGYCGQDFKVMQAGAKATPLLSQQLFEDYLVNERINGRGVRIDRPMARAAHAYAFAERAELGGKLARVTDGIVDSPTQHTRVCKWVLEALEEAGSTEAIKLMTRYKVNKKTKEKEKKYSSDKTVRANLLTDPVALGVSEDVVRVLELMNDASGSATSKFHKMDILASPEDDRVRGSLRFAGAPSTIRYSSMGLQLHNMIRDSFSVEEVAHYRHQMLTRQILTHPLTGRAVPLMETLGKLTRAAIIPEEGKVFVVGDWNAVESRMTAWVAREQSKLDVFHRGECPYCFAAESVYKRPITEENDPTERQVGKVVDLACGFLGGPGALAAMASSYGLYIPEDERQAMVDSWRGRHPNIVNYGNLLHSSAIRAMRSRGKWIKADRVSYLFDGSSLYCKLPDGKTLLRYPEARIGVKPAPWDETQMIPDLTALKAAFTKGQDDDEWPRHSLWRGLLLENVVQACCAILLRDMVDCFQDDCVFHVHDELILEVIEAMAEQMAAELEQEMEIPPEWCSDLPLVAKPKTMTIYGK